MRFLLSLLLLAACSAHELEDNRAQLVLRDRTHLSLTLFIGYVDALHMALAPQKPLQEFVLVHSVMKMEDLQKELNKAQAKFQAATHVYMAPGTEIPLSGWIWPDAKQVQALLQQRAMQAMVDPSAHTHEPPVEIRADAAALQEISSVQVQFPEEFQKVLVVAFRPSQTWVERKALSPAIKF